MYNLTIIKEGTDYFAVHPIDFTKHKCRIVRDQRPGKHNSIQIPAPINELTVRKFVSEHLMVGQETTLPPGTIKERTYNPNRIPRDVKAYCNMHGWMEYANEQEMAELDAIKERIEKRVAQSKLVDKKTELLELLSKAGLSIQDLLSQE